MAYLHLLREASTVMDEGATYSHHGAIGHYRGARIAVRLAFLERAIVGEEPEAWWTRVEVALDADAPIDLAGTEADGPEAAFVRNAWIDPDIELASFETRFRIDSSLANRGADESFPSPALRMRMLRHPPFVFRVATEVDVDEGRDRSRTTDGSEARRHLAGAPVLVLDGPGTYETIDIENLVELAALLAGEIRGLARAAPVHESPVSSE